MTASCENFTALIKPFDHLHVAGQRKYPVPQTRFPFKETSLPSLLLPADIRIKQMGRKRASLGLLKIILFPNGMTSLDGLYSF